MWGHVSLVLQIIVVSSSSSSNRCLERPLKQAISSWRVSHTSSPPVELITQSLMTGTIHTTEAMCCLPSQHTSCMLG